MRFTVLLVLLFCETMVHAESCSNHPWSNSLPASFNEHQFKAITDLSKPVIESEIASAKKILEQVPVMEISDVQASVLIGEEFKNQTAYHLYLVRALKDNQNASVVVYRHKDFLYLESVRMEPDSKVVEVPVVVKLDFSPAHVYIACTESIL